MGLDSGNDKKGIRSRHPTLLIVYSRLKFEFSKIHQASGDRFSNTRERELDLECRKSIFLIDSLKAFYYVFFVAKSSFGKKLHASISSSLSGNVSLV